ncbi:unnamed protein product [Schistocephalus solidus]|uniref:MAM domain-containing protein n=1 Tax=Schistocephalus solidus TaxID=70667 RepID=A0A183T8H4_SCHSO|nr:unnamed protein product [Schistocephalus solidus]
MRRLAYDVVEPVQLDTPVSSTIFTNTAREIIIGKDTALGKNTGVVLAENEESWKQSDSCFTNIFTCRHGIVYRCWLFIDPDSIGKVPEDCEVPRLILFKHASSPDSPWHFMLTYEALQNRHFAGNESQKQVFVVGARLMAPPSLLWQVEGCSTDVIRLLPGRWSQVTVEWNTTHMTMLFNGRICATAPLATVHNVGQGDSFSPRNTPFVFFGKSVRPFPTIECHFTQLEGMISGQINPNALALTDFCRLSHELAGLSINLLKVNVNQSENTEDSFEKRNARNPAFPISTADPETHPVLHVKKRHANCVQGCKPSTPALQCFHALEFCHFGVTVSFWMVYIPSYQKDKPSMQQTWRVAELVGRTNSRLSISLAMDWTDSEQRRDGEVALTLMAELRMDRYYEPEHTFANIWKATVSPSQMKDANAKWAFVVVSWSDFSGLEVSLNKELMAIGNRTLEREREVSKTPDVLTEGLFIGGLLAPDRWSGNAGEVLIDEFHFIPADRSRLDSIEQDIEYVGRLPFEDQDEFSAPDQNSSRTSSFAFVNVESENNIRLLFRIPVNSAEKEIEKYIEFHGRTRRSAPERSNMSERKDVLLSFEGENGTICALAIVRKLVSTIT